MADTPNKIGKYQIRSLLGSGGMGVVYLGFDPDIKRTVAIKILHQHLTDSGKAKSIQSRFRREAQAAARCSHPNIVSVYDLGNDDGKDFIVMEYVQGEELKFFLDSGNNFSLAESLHIISMVLDGLQTAHKFDVIHRDIKPANIILLDTGEIKIADFGVAKIEVSDLTVAGNVVGTPSYMSPEGLSGETVDQRADIYSTGMVLFEMLTGEKPTPKELYSQPPSAFIGKVLQRERGMALSPEIRAIMQKALADKKRNRYQCAADFLADIAGEQANSSTATPAAAILAETIISQRPLIRPQPDVDRLDDIALGKLEQGLTSYIGPVAKLLIKKGSSNNQAPIQLVEELSLHIDNISERNDFLKLAHRCIQDGTNHSTFHSKVNTHGGMPAIAEILTPAQIAKISKILTFYLGPFARKIVERHAKTCHSINELHHSLADQIPDSSEKIAFLKQVSR